MQEPIVPAAAPESLTTPAPAQGAQQAVSHPAPGSTPSEAPAPAQPLPLAQRAYRLPATLRERPQWLVAGPDEHGAMKVPMSVGPTGKLYRSNTTRSAWLPFERALEVAVAHGYGIGYALADDDPCTCIDMDVKPWTSAEARARFESIVAQFNSYTERSQSGQGLHVWCLGAIGEGRKRDGVEVYSQGRFIACTGDVIHDLPLQPRQHLLDAMVPQMETAGGVKVDLEERHETEADDEVLRQARTAANAAKFNQLWAGTWQAMGYPSQSEADLALMAILAYYSKSNEQCRRLFRRSALGARDKHIDSDRHLDYMLKRIRGRQAEEAADLGGGTVEHGRQVAEAILKNLMLKTPMTAAPATAWPLVSVADVCSKPAPPIEFLIEDLLPAREVTLLPADGGAGKSLLTLIAAVCQAMGLPFMGKTVTRCKVIFFSGEDDDRVLRGRLRRICEHYSVNPAELAEWLLVIDAAENPCLFTEEVEEFVGRRAVPTGNLFELDRQIGQWHARLVVIDNASDTYDANENVRQFVRAFVRRLKSIAKEHDAAVLLLAHLDKASVRGEGGRAKFSGSTAWHNSVRSRLLLLPSPDVHGQMVLSQEKSNHGRRSADIFLAWSPEGVLMHAGGGVHIPAATPDELRERVLTLIRTRYEQGMFISTSLAANAPTGAYASLSADPAFPPQLDKARLAALLRQAQADGLLQVELYESPTRRGHRVERWRVC